MATVNQLVRKPRKSPLKKATLLPCKLVHKDVVYVLVYILLRLRNQTLHCVKYVVCV